MVDVNTCLDDDVLGKLGRNELTQAECETVLQHLEKCDECAHRANATSCDDVLVDLVREAGGTPVVVHADALVAEIRRLWPGDFLQETVVLGQPADGGNLDNGRPVETTPADAVSVAELKPSRLYDFLAPPQQPGELGRLGTYRALEVLGSGGMGVVFRAEDSLLRRPAALKVMLPGIAADPDGKERFLREARAAASIRHDHVVTIYQVDEQKGIPFLAMELLEGETLETRLNRDGKLPAGEALRIGREIAEGLAAAHDLGLVHRDIKPSNIWLEPRPAKTKVDESASGLVPLMPSRVRVKILDFGLACGVRDEGRLTRKGVIIGTAAYMSPEQARGETPDPPGDLFSLGCVLYAMCAGKQPFSGSNFISTLVAVVSFAPRHLRELEPELPAEFADLVMQLLEKEPAQRPQSAHEVVEKITALEKSVRSPRKDRSGKTARTRSGKKVLASTLWRPRTVFLAIAAVLLIGGGGWLAAILLRVQTPTGTLIIKSDDKNVQVRISAGDHPVAQIDLSDPRANRELRLKVGAYDVELLGAREGLSLKSRHFTIEDGKTSKIEVLFEPKGLKKPPEPWGKEPPPPPPRDSKKGFKEKGPHGDKGPFQGGPPPDKGPPMKGFEPKGPRDEFMRARRDAF